MDDAAGHSARTSPCNSGPSACASPPEFRRLKYAYGQLLGASDFQTEQNYFREKQRLHNRCLHGYGVVCGLLVRPLPPPPDCLAAAFGEAETLRKELAGTVSARDREPDGDKKAALSAKIEKLRQQLSTYPPEPCLAAPPVKIVIDCGLAIDCNGDELVVRRPIPVDLWALLSPEERKSADGRKVDLYVSICYCEQPIDPFRPIVADHCSAVADCVYGKLRESVSVRVSLAAPEPDTRCETCCSPCKEPCILLARICGFEHGCELSEDDILNDVRRRIGLYQHTVITAINWVHGAAYLRHEAEALLGTEDDSSGLEVHLSRPVWAEQLAQRGVVELWRIEGGKGRSGYFTEIRGHCHPQNVVDGMARSFRYRQTDRESLDYGDRILITIRCAFILDACCRPLDGANVGGRVPLLPGSVDPQKQPPRHECAIPPWGYGPWTSGNGAPGSSFESWIVVSERDDHCPEPPALSADRGATS